MECRGDIESLTEAVRKRVMVEIDNSMELSETELLEMIDFAIMGASEYSLNIRERLQIRNEVFNSIRRLDILQDIIDDDEITEVMINGYHNIFVEKNGRIVRYNRSFSSELKLQDIVQRIAAQANKIVNETVPIIDTRLINGSRVNIVMNPIAIDGPVVTIRKFYNTPLSIERLIQLGAITEEAALFLKALVVSKYNIFISGGTGSGKTTFLNALSNFIPKDERVITIEDSAELKLMGIENLVRLEARSANVEGKNEVTIRDMIKASLRMRPDRLVVGEVRGQEALDMLQAMNTGHDGSLSTGHANGPEEMIIRLETMVLMAMDMPISAIRNQIASAIDIIVHLGRLRDGSRKVLKICEVQGMDKNGLVCLNSLYEYVTEGVNTDGGIMGALKKTKNNLINTGKMQG